MGEQKKPSTVLSRMLPTPAPGFASVAVVRDERRFLSSACCGVRSPGYEAAGPEGDAMDKAPTSRDGLSGSIRARLRDRTLPSTDGLAWAGKGQGINQCVCCGMRIERSDQE